MAKKPIEVPGSESAPEAADDVAVAQARQAELDRQVAATSTNLVGSDKALDWSHLTLPAAIHGQINHENPDDKLPHPDDIDWAKVPARENKVLTRHGWLHRPA